MKDDLKKQAVERLKRAVIGGGLNREADRIPAGYAYVVVEEFMDRAFLDGKGEGYSEGWNDGRKRLGEEIKKLWP